VLVVGRGGDVVAGGERGGVRPQEVLVPGRVVFVPAGDDDRPAEADLFILSLPDVAGCISSNMEGMRAATGNSVLKTSHMFLKYSAE